MADYIVSSDGAAFFLSANADGLPSNPFKLSFFPQANRRLVVALDGDDFIEGTVDIDQVNGNMGNDNIFASGGDDFLMGGRGEDGLNGDDGNDFLHGNLDDDFLFGDAGNDIVRGGRGDDFLNGGEGSDLLIGELGFDVLIGGEGNDNFIVRTDSVTDPLTGQVLSNAVFNVLAADQIVDFLWEEDDKILLPGINGFTDFALEDVDVDSDGVLDAAIRTVGGYVAVVLSVSSDFLDAEDFIFEPQATAIFAGATRGLVTPPVLA
ncbi:calcium-binding protein [Ancylothrix sp. C2]|uniref:calcium-binding protein n=1 Tax=Ancylothrix sp. D3o TaxID=2953691 RepID=UPI0021BA7BF4|nr:calcium-binding protein [Ancylothrix sp. D3o]MCT7949669.1 calcium-binding protein [Ancylothrix sp. D3o]